MRHTVAIAALCLPLLASPAVGQIAAPGGATPPAPPRAQLEQQLRRRLWAIAQTRVGLTDGQMVRLQTTAQRFDGRRRALAVDERQQRTILRQEILADAQADQGRIAAALDRLLQLQRARVDLQGEEQRELATFMTPIQRAKYAALQEQLRRRAEALRRQRADSGAVRRGR